MENIYAIPFIIAILANVVWINLYFRMKKNTDILNVLTNDLKSSLSLSEMNREQLVKQVDEFRIEYNDLKRRNNYTILLLNTINKEWLKGIRVNVKPKEETNITILNSVPTLTFKFDFDREEYEVKKTFKKENIAKDVYLKVNLNNQTYISLNSLVDDLNKCNTKFIEEGGYIPSNTAMELRINKLNEN